MAKKDKYKKVNEGRVKTYEALKRIRLQEANKSDKKSLAVKDISRVLTDIEEAKRTQKIIYFSQIQGMGVYDTKKRRIGVVKDLAIAGGSVFPEVSHVLVKRKNVNVLIPWRQVSITKVWIELNSTFDKVDSRIANDDDVFLGANILDKQVVDVNGLKVIRVNDLALTQIKGKLAVISIDVGSRSILRRLGLFHLADKIPGFKDHPVPWGSVEPLTRSLEKIHLKVPCARVSDLHPADAADVFDELSMLERKILLRSMKSDTAAKVILECEPEVRASIIKSLKAKRLALILEKMPANDAANILSEFGKYDQEFLLKNMNKLNASKIQELLAYKDGTVARYMSNVFVTVRNDLTAKETVEFIRQLANKPTSFHYIYVVDETEVLCGVLSLKHLIMADPETPIREIMISKVVTIEISDPIEYVEEIISKYDLLALPVVDINGRIRGVVDIDDVLNVIVERTKTHQPFELSDKEMTEIKEEKQLKKYYSNIIKDIGQLLRDLEPTGMVRRRRK